MNSVAKGDLFEEKCYSIISSALHKGELGVIPNICKIFKKKKYFSVKRNSEIIFDLTIEVQPQGANKPTLVYIIECKNLGNKVPVDDVEEFESKISGLHGFQVKGVMISSTSFQRGGFSTANNLGLLLIEVSDTGYEIVLYSKTQNNNIDRIQESIRQAIYKGFDIVKIEGLARLSKSQINKISNNILGEFYQYSNTAYTLENFIQYLGDCHKLTIEIAPESSNFQGKFLPNLNKILINKNLIGNSLKYNFVLLHEISHFYLHKNVMANKNIYEAFTDVEFDYVENKYTLQNPRNWIEWQANYLASCLALPEDKVLATVVLWQINNGIRNKGTIFLDDQPVNYDDYKSLSNILSQSFKISKTAIKYRLIDMQILKIAPSFYKKFVTKKRDEIEDVEEIRRKNILRAKELYGF